MQVADLRALSIFDGLADEQLGELIAGGTEVAIVPGTELFREGAPADFWWVLVDGSIDLLRHVGREETVVARMDEPGRWAGGFRAWDEAGTYLATGRGARPGRVLRVPAEVLRDRSTTWFPFGGHLIRGLYHTARSIESTVRQRESLVTLGTLAAGLAHEINNPAAAATRSVDALESTSETLLSSLARLAHDDISAAQFAGLDELRREIEPRALDPDPLARADREQDLGAWLSRHAVSDAWRLAPALAAAGVDPAWCARAETILGGSSLEPALEWVASTFSVSTLLGETEGVDATDLRTRRRHAIVLPARPGLAAEDRGGRRARDHAGDAQPQTERHHRGTGLRRRRHADRGVRGRTQSGLDQPDRQRHRRDGRRGHVAGVDPQRR